MMKLTQPLYKCQRLRIESCRRYVNNTVLPNILGYVSQDYAALELPFLLPLADTGCSPHLHRFICAMYAPDCTKARFEHNHLIPTPPCRSLCEISKKGCHLTMALLGLQWPTNFNCSKLPDDREIQHNACIGSILPKPTPPPSPKPANKIQLSYSSSSKNNAGTTEKTFQRVEILARRYDIQDLGNPMYFRGWVDVQGQGAANDYCRFVREGRSQFLSCVLAGSKGWGHTYISERGLDPGWRNTWFMRDMNGDGRDDYCRCLGEGFKSKVKCVKAGRHGFHDGDTRYDFELPNTKHCAYKKVNPFFGR